MKKIMFKIGTTMTMITPIVTTVACSANEKEVDYTLLINDYSGDTIPEIQLPEPVELDEQDLEKVEKGELSQEDLTKLKKWHDAYFETRVILSNKIADEIIDEATNDDAKAVNIISTINDLNSDGEKITIVKDIKIVPSSIHSSFSSFRDLKNAIKNMNLSDELRMLKQDFSEVYDYPWQADTRFTKLGYFVYRTIVGNFFFESIPNADVRDWGYISALEFANTYFGRLEIDQAKYTILTESYMQDETEGIKIPNSLVLEETDLDKIATGDLSQNDLDALKQWYDAYLETRVNISNGLAEKYFDFTGDNIDNKSSYALDITAQYKDIDKNGNVLNATWFEKFKIENIRRGYNWANFGDFKEAIEVATISDDDLTLSYDFSSIYSDVWTAQTKFTNLGFYVYKTLVGDLFIKTTPATEFDNWEEYTTEKFVKHYLPTV